MTRPEQFDIPSFSTYLVCNFLSSCETCRRARRGDVVCRGMKAPTLTAGLVRRIGAVERERKVPRITPCLANRVTEYVDELHERPAQLTTTNRAFLGDDCPQICEVSNPHNRSKYAPHFIFNSPLVD
jgi:hypothetical protein